MLPVMTTITIQERVSRLAGLLAREREALAEFIAELASFDAGRSWEELGYPSLFEFLTRELRLSRGAAFYRTKAVWLVQRFPEVLGAIREGKLYINSIAEVARVLTPENRAEVLPRFFYQSREDAKLLSVELVPREVVPVREVVTSLDLPAAPQGPASSNPVLTLVPPPNDLASTSPVHSVNGDDSKVVDRTGQASAAVVRPEATEPMTGQLSRVHLTITRELAAKIETAQLALSHTHPNASIADVLELGAETALAQDAKRKGLVKQPRARRSEATSVPPESDHIPAELRRAVWKRDQGCCQWKLANGEVCGSRYRLQYDHIEPKAKGGQTTFANLRLLCQRHNLLAARMAYGEKVMSLYRRGVLGPRAIRSARFNSETRNSRPRSTRRESRAPVGHP
jgi:5-methylcytosine-specific restriction endonuclease McrA